MKLVVKHNRPGFGLTQALVGLTMTSFLAIGAYKVMHNVGTVTQTTVATVNGHSLHQKVTDQLVAELSNTVAIEDIGESVLKNIEPNACKGALGAPAQMSAAIIPFPGRSYADINARTNLAAIEPSDATYITGTDGKLYDAIRYVYRPSSSKSYSIALNASDSDKPYVTSGTNALVIDGTPDINVGDYFVISDIEGTALGRVTSKASCNSGKTCLYKSTGSIWNVASMRNYGRDVAGDKLDGGATVEKVNIATIAYDPTTKILYRDDHFYDDGFTLTATTLSSAALAKKWRAIATNVKNFQVNYSVAVDGDEEAYTFIRTPRVGEWGEENTAAAPYCGNQLGFPNMRQISVSVESDQGISTKTVAINALQANNGGDGSGGGGSFEAAQRSWTGTYVGPSIGAYVPCSTGPCYGGGIY